MRKLTASDLDEIEGKLVSLRGDLLAEIQAWRGHGGAGNACGPGVAEGDRAGMAGLVDSEVGSNSDSKVDCDDRHANAGAHWKTMALSEPARERLRAIDDALQRIEFGVGGVCIHCGVPIAIERLRMVPTATLCLVCAQCSR